MSRKKRPKRVSKAEWLSAALEMLEAGGIASVRIERLAEKVGISKSGFYWHFKDRQALHKQLLDYWSHEYTVVVTGNPQLWRGDPTTRLAITMKMIQEHDLAKYDLVIRAWAKHDPMAANAFKSVTKKRLDFVRAIYSDMGLEGDELEMRAMLFVCYHTWESTMFGDMSPRKRTRLQKNRLALLTKK